MGHTEMLLLLLVFAVSFTAIVVFIFLSTKTKFIICRAILDPITLLN